MIYSDVISTYKKEANEERAVASAIVEMLGPKYDGDIVDLGSGPGIVLGHLRRAGYMGNFIAVDLEAQIFSESANATFVRANVENWAPALNERFGVALLSHVLPDIAPNIRTRVLNRWLHLCHYGVLIASNRMDSLFGRFLLSLWQYSNGFNHYIDWPTMVEPNSVMITKRIEYVVNVRIARIDFIRCIQLFTPYAVAPDVAAALIKRYWPEGGMLDIEVPQALYLLQRTGGMTLQRADGQADRLQVVDARNVW